MPREPRKQRQRDLFWAIANLTRAHADLLEVMEQEIARGYFPAGVRQVDAEAHNYGPDARIEVVETGDRAMYEVWVNEKIVLATLSKREAYERWAKEDTTPAATPDGAAVTKLRGGK